MSFAHPRDPREFHSGHPSVSLGDYDVDNIGSARYVAVQTEETLDTETRALAIRLKNKIWACGMKLLGGVVIA